MLPFCDIIHLYHFYSVFRLARKLFQESQQYETKLNCFSPFLFISRIDLSALRTTRKELLCGQIKA